MCLLSLDFAIVISDDDEESYGNDADDVDNGDDLTTDMQQIQYL